LGEKKEEVEENSFWCLPIAETHRGDRKRSWKFRRWLCFKSSSGTAPLLVGRLVAVHAGGDAGEQGPSRRGRSCRDPGGTGRRVLALAALGEAAV